MNLTLLKQGWPSQMTNAPANTTSTGPGKFDLSHWLNLVVVRIWFDWIPIG